METDRLFPSLRSLDVARLQRRRYYGSILILVSQLLERCAYYSLLANLAFMLNAWPLEWMSYNAMNATFLYTGVTYVMALVGGFLADACLAKFNTIIIGYAIYIIGYVGIPLLNYSNNHKDSHFCLKFDPIPLSNISIMEKGTNDFIGDEKCSTLILLSLTFVGIGSGFVKSVIAPFGADQIRHGGMESMRSFFLWYYWVLNSGTFVAYLVFAFVQINFSKFVGYTVPGCLLLLSFILFIIGRPLYSILPASGSVCAGVCSVIHESCKRRCCICCKRRVALRRRNELIQQRLIDESSIDYYSDGSYNFSSREPSALRDRAATDTSDLISSEDLSDGDTDAHWSINFFDLAKVRYGGSHHESLVEDVKVLGRITLVLLCLISYWLVYFQLPASWLSLFDVVTLLIILPILDRVVYPWLDRRELSPSLTMRMCIGMGFAILAVVTAGCLEVTRLYFWDKGWNTTNYIESTTYNAVDISIFSQIPQYTFIGISEAFTSVAGLEFVYRQAPKSMQNLINGMYWFFSGVGSFLGIMLITLLQKTTWFSEDDHGDMNYARMDYYFFLLAGVQFTGLMVFILIIRFYPIQRTDIYNTARNRQSPASFRDHTNPSF